MGPLSETFTCTHQVPFSAIVGALLALAVENTSETAMIVLGTLAVALAMINVVGGYLVTDRMLGMFKQKKRGQ